MAACSATVDQARQPLDFRMDPLFIALAEKSLEDDCRRCRGGGGGCCCRRRRCRPMLAHVVPCSLSNFMETEEDTCTSRSCKPRHLIS